MSVAASLPVLSAELEDIRERGYLVVAVKDNVQPLGFRDSNGELQGLEIDIARRLAQELLGDEGRIVFEPVGNQERLPTLLNGNADLVIARLTVTASRARLVAFSYPYYVDGTAVVTRVPELQSISDLSLNRAIAVLSGSTTINHMRFLLPDASLVGVNSYGDALNLLESNQADAFAADASVLAGWVQQYPEYRILPTLLSAEALSIAMPKGLQYDDLRRQINAAIIRWEDEGWLQERIEYWGLPD